MKKEKVILYISTILALAAAILFFFRWNPENLLWRTETPVTMSDIEQNKAVDFTGSPAGDDIFRLSGAEDFENMLNYVDYATAKPIKAIPTGVYSLKPWESYFSSRTVNGRTGIGRRRAEVIKSAAGLVENYNQYYLLGLSDGSYILAQLPQSKAAAIKKGKSVILPIGQKAGIPDAARNYLADICGEYGASMEGVLYTLDNEWYKEHSFTLFIIRFAAASVLFFILAVGLLLTGNKVFGIKEEDERAV